MSARSPTARRLAVGLLLAALLVAGALAAPTFAARQTVLGADRVAIADATVTIEHRTDRPRLAAQFEVWNPTPHAITLVYGQLVATNASDGERLTRLTTTPFDRAITVPAGGEASVETFLPIGEGDIGKTRAALDGGTLSIDGEIRATVVREPIDVAVAGPVEEE